MLQQLTDTIREKLEEVACYDYSSGELYNGELYKYIGTTHSDLAGLIYNTFFGSYSCPQDQSVLDQIMSMELPDEVKAAVYGASFGLIVTGLLGVHNASRTKQLRRELDELTHNEFVNGKPLVEAILETDDTALIFNAAKDSFDALKNTLETASNPKIPSLKEQLVDAKSKLTLA